MYPNKRSDLGSDRPKIRPEKEPIDVLMEITGLVAVVGMLVLTVVKYPGLPETIPTHFDAAGVPDGFGNKGMIWLLPGINLLMFTGLYFLSRFPWTWNYPVNITAENAQRLYRHGTRSMRILNLLLVIMFSYLTWQSIASATGKSDGLGIWFMPVTLVVILGYTAYMIIRMYRLK